MNEITFTDVLYLTAVIGIITFMFVIGCWIVGIVLIIAVLLEAI